jgi:hypothetical protein
MVARPNAIFGDDTKNFLDDDLLAGAFRSNCEVGVFVLRMARHKFFRPPRSKVKSTYEKIHLSGCENQGRRQDVPRRVHHVHVQAAAESRPLHVRMQPNKSIYYNWEDFLLFLYFFFLSN